MKFMDLLYHRYASPLALLDMVIGSGQLEEFVKTMLEQIDEEKLWELYLHLIIKEQSFDDWKASLAAEAEKENGRDMEKSSVSQGEINAAIHKSQVILENFVPE